MHSFGHGTDGFQPLGSLIFDKAGNLYGVTTGAVGEFGTVFELTSGTGGTWTEKILHVFTKNGADGLGPNGPLTMDASGNLYGTTVAGGSGACSGGCGTVYELSPQAGGIWSETILHSFLDNGADGIEPTSGLTFDSSGNLYGVTSGGGINGKGAGERTSRTPTGPQCLPWAASRESVPGRADVSVETAGGASAVAVLGAATWGQPNGQSRKTKKSTAARSNLLVQHHVFREGIGIC